MQWDGQRSASSGAWKGGLAEANEAIGVAGGQHGRLALTATRTSG